MSDTHYVYNDTEVKLTGRKAIKSRPPGRTVTSAPPVIYEVTPADLEEGSWKKWVKLTDLYQIQKD